MRKHILPLLLLPFTAVSQVQVGNSITGTKDHDGFGNFGALSDDGKVLALTRAGNYSESNIVRVFGYSSGDWEQIGEDIQGIPSSLGIRKSIALSSDGSIVAVGLPLDNDNTGYVAVFENKSGVWTQVGVDIKGSIVNSFSGDQVALSADGSVLAVSEPCYYGDCSGQVKVYKNMAGSWTQSGSSIVREGDRGRCSIDLSADGNRLFIGTQNSSGSGTTYGKVKVYSYVSGDWGVQGYPVAGQASPYLGKGGALSQDGETVAFAVEGYYGSGFKNSVSVYRHNSGMWAKIGQPIVGDDMYDRMGESLSLSADGNVLVVGATYYNASSKFFAYVRVYQFLNGSWVQAGNDIKGEELSDHTGTFVSLSADGTRVAIGAPDIEGDGSIFYPGQVRVFDLSGVLSSDAFVELRTAVYPNPATDVIYIELKDGLTFKEVTIYNSLGQQVKKSNSSTVRTTGLASGIYYAVITTDRGKATHKIVVK